VITGGALTIATAGYSATFTIQAKDSWKNVRTVDGSEFFVQVTGPGTEKHRNPMRYIGSYSDTAATEAGPSTNLGRYTVAYRSTQSGTFALDVKMASENGLLGVYYRDAEFSNAVYEAASNLDFNWGSDQPAVDALGILDGSLSLSLSRALSHAHTHTRSLSITHTYTLGVLDGTPNPAGEKILNAECWTRMQTSRWLSRGTSSLSTRTLTPSPPRSSPLHLLEPSTPNRNPLPALNPKPLTCALNP
jgi:hypothetical protein